MEQKPKQVKKPQSNLIKTYLIIYNTVEAVGWFLILYNLLSYYINSEVSEPLYDHIKWLVIIFPNSAVLEILHAVTGLVPSSAFVTAQQVYSRVLLVCGVILPTIAVKQSFGFTLTFFAWSFTETIRYSFYALNLLNVVPYIHLWLRYSIFLVAFPLGVCGECWMLYVGQQEFGKTGRWSFTLPNCLNMTFNYQYFLAFHIFGLLAGVGGLFKHMLVQRKKALGVSTEKKKHT